LQNFFGFIIHPMELGLTWLATTVGNAGIGIILFTLFIRLVLSPLQITQLRSSRSMQRLQPMIAELRKKHFQRAVKAIDRGLMLAQPADPPKEVLDARVMQVYANFVAGYNYAAAVLGEQDPVRPHQEATLQQVLRCDGGLPLRALAVVEPDVVEMMVQHQLAGPRGEACQGDLPSAAHHRKQRVERSPLQLLVGGVRTEDVML